MAESKFTWLGANVKDKSSGKLLGNTLASKVYTFSNGALSLFKSGLAADSLRAASGVSVRVGFFGICTPDTPRQSYPGQPCRTIA